MNRDSHTQNEGALAVAAPGYSRELRVRPARRRELLAHFAGAFDLAEERDSGHAARVAYLAHQVAYRLELGVEGSLRALDAGLLHASGSSVNPDAPRSGENAWVIRQFGLDDAVVEVMASIHECWDGTGEPLGRAGTDIPVESLCVVAAHWASDYADAVAHPLRARMLLREAAEAQLAPRSGALVAEALCDVLREDTTWLTVFADDLTGVVARMGATETRPSHAQVYEAAHAMGAVIDAAVREPGRALAVSILAGELAAELGMPPAACDLVGVAGYLLDIGQLGVPRSITVKPSILTVDEMETMRRHPGLGARVLEGIPGFDEVSLWVEQHHERPDGRGYPGMLDSADLPLPSLILSVADAYWALRARRPYRAGHSAEETLRILRDAAGPQFDADVVMALEGAVSRAVELFAETEPPADAGPRLVRED